MAGDNVDSDLDLAKKMFGFAREIVEKSPENTMEKVKILFAPCGNDHVNCLPRVVMHPSAVCLLGFGVVHFGQLSCRFKCLEVSLLFCYTCLIPVKIS